MIPVRDLPPPGPCELVYGVDPVTGKETSVGFKPVPDQAPPVTIAWDDLDEYRTIHGLQTKAVIPLPEGRTLLVVERTKP